MSFLFTFLLTLCLCRGIYMSRRLINAQGVCMGGMSTYASVYGAGKEENMINNKIQMMLSYRNQTQKLVQDALELGSKQATYQKLTRRSIKIDELIKICEALDCEIAIRDKSTGKDVVIFDKDDLKK